MRFPAFASLSALLAAGSPADVGAWYGRARFRLRLARLLDEPHLLADLGFDAEAVRVEIARPMWQPVRLRRGARSSADQSAVGRARPSLGVDPLTPAAAPRL